MKFSVFLREDKGQSPRSCWNKFSNVMSFLKHYDVTPKIKPHDWPKFVEEEPEIYDQETLDKFFAACDADETLLFEFFLQTGMREQEVIYATDRCVDFANYTVSVKRNPQHGWTPKMYSGHAAPNNPGRFPGVLSVLRMSQAIDQGIRSALSWPLPDRGPSHALSVFLSDTSGLRA